MTDRMIAFSGQYNVLKDFYSLCKKCACLLDLARKCSGYTHTFPSHMYQHLVKEIKLMPIKALFLLVRLGKTSLKGRIHCEVFR